MTKDQLNSATTFDAAKFYDSFGLQLVPIPRENKHKEPKGKGWQDKTFDLKHFVDECNIGSKRAPNSRNQKACSSPTWTST